eukprot:10697707-Ditylum_brightwellii.AAC.1
MGGINGYMSSRLPDEVLFLPWRYMMAGQMLVWNWWRTQQESLESRRAMLAIHLASESGYLLEENDVLLSDPNYRPGTRLGSWFGHREGDLAGWRSPYLQLPRSMM